MARAVPSAYVSCWRASSRDVELRGQVSVFWGWNCVLKITKQYSLGQLRKLENKTEYLGL
jgi:hypothetical protein